MVSIVRSCLHSRLPCLAGTFFILASLILGCGPPAEDPSAQGVRVNAETLPAVGLPLAQRRFTAKAWTGSEVFIFGGTSSESAVLLNDGALLDPVTLEVLEPLPPSPLPLPLGSPSAIATTTGVLVVGVLCDASGESLCNPKGVGAALFSLSDREWKDVSPPLTADAARTLGLTRSGLAVIEMGDRPGLYWTFDPTTAEWGRLPPPPTNAMRKPVPNGLWDGPVLASCVSGESIIVIESAEPLDPGTMVGPQGVRTHALEVSAATAWSTSIDDNIRLFDRPGLVCAKDGAIIVPARAPANGMYRFYLNEKHWRPITSAAAQLGDIPAISTAFVTQGWNGRELVFPGGSNLEILIYDDEKGNWRLGPRSGGVAEEPPLWIGDRFLAESASSEAMRLTVDGAAADLSMVETFPVGALCTFELE